MKSINVKTFILLLVVFLLSLKVEAQKQYLGPDENYNIDLGQIFPYQYDNFVDSNNNKFLLYKHESIIIKKNVAGLWVDFSDDTLKKYTDNAIVYEIGVSPSGTIFIVVFINNSDNEVRTLKYENNKWVYLNSIANPLNSVSHIELKFVNNDILLALVYSLSEENVRFFKLQQSNWIVFASCFIENYNFITFDVYNNEINLAHSNYNSDSLFIKIFRNNSWINIPHPIKFNSILDQFVSFQFYTKVQNQHLFVESSDSIYFLHYNQNNNSFDLDSAYMPFFLGIKFNNIGDYCMAIKDYVGIKFISNNTNYPWHNKQVKSVYCSRFNPDFFKMTKDFLPLYNNGIETYVVSDTLIDLNKDALGGLPSFQMILKRNLVGETFLLMNSSSCFARAIEVFKYDGDNWNRLGSEIFAVSDKVILEIDPITHKPFVAISGFNTFTIKEFKNNEWVDFDFMIPHISSNGLQDFRINSLGHLIILTKNSACFIFNNGIWIEMLSSSIKAQIDIFENSRIFIDKNDILHIVGYELNTEQYKIIKLISGSWNSFPVCEFENRSSGSYDVKFDSQNRFNIIYRYYNKRAITGVLRFNQNENSWEEPYGGYQINQSNNSIELFFGNDDKPYSISLGANGAGIGNIRILSVYNNIWDDVPNVSFNEGTSNILYSYYDNNDLYLAFNGVANNVVKYNFNTVTSTQDQIKSDDEILVYPNPANSTIYFNVKEMIGENVQIKISNLLGEELLLRTNVNLSEPFDIPHLSNGMYLINISDYKNFNNTYKILIEK